MAHAEEAARSSVSMRALLTWASKIARPGEGAPKVLMAIARLGRADWVEGTPYVEIRGDDDFTTLSVFADHGLGIRERVVPLVRLGVPIDEFARAVRLAPQLVAPFKSQHHETMLLLTLPESALEAPREAIKIDDSSLHEQERKTAPPPLVSDSPVTDAPPSIPERSGVHTHPTVRRMIAVRPEALRSGNDDSD